jgi:hypothetical protein
MVSAMKLYGTVRFFPLLTDCRTPEFRFPETDSRFLTLGDAARNPANAALLLSCWPLAWHLCRPTGGVSFPTKVSFVPTRSWRPSRSWQLLSTKISFLKLIPRECTG